MRVRFLFESTLAVTILFVGSPAWADCTVPLAPAGTIQFFTPDLKFCDGANWLTLAVSGSSGYINGGNAYGANASIGLNDNYRLDLETNGTSRMTIAADGNVGIGTTAPASALDTVGRIQQTGNGLQSNMNGYLRTNSTGVFSSTQLYPGLLVYQDPGSYQGIDAGYNSTSTRYRIRTFTSDYSDIAFSFHVDGVDPTQQSHFSDAMVIRGDNKNVGIGTASPGAKLTVAGAIVSTPSNISSGGAVDLSLSDTFTLASVGGAAITLSNMVHGGSYTLIIQDTAVRTYTFSGCNTSKFKPANTDTTASSHTIYNLLTVYNGASYDCYITWASGYL